MYDIIIMCAGPAGITKESLKLNKYGEIIVNERCETNIPGLFSAGCNKCSRKTDNCHCWSRLYFKPISFQKYLSKKTRVKN